MLYTSERIGMQFMQIARSGMQFERSHLPRVNLNWSWNVDRSNKLNWCLHKNDTYWVSQLPPSPE